MVVNIPAQLKQWKRQWQSRWKNPQLQRIWRSRASWIALPMVSGSILLLRSLALLQPLELIAYDQQMRLRPPQGKDPRILIIGIDERDLQTVKEWPIPDCVLARALNQIKRHRPITIGLDLYRDFPISTHNALCPKGYELGTQRLYEIFRTTPTLVGIEKRRASAQEQAVAPPPLLNRETQIGVNNFMLDPDGRVRRALLYFDEGDDRYPSFALNLALNYLEKHQITPETGSEFLKLQGHEFIPFESKDGGYQRADARSYQIIINYRTLDHSFDTFSLRDLLAGRVPADKIQNRIVLIGTTAASINDRFSTTQSSSIFEGSPRLVPGIEIHAHIISQLISTAIDRRPGISVWSEPIETFWIIFWTGFGIFLYGLPPREVRLSQRFIRREGILLTGLMGLFLSTTAAMAIGLWLPIVPAIVGIVSGVISMTIYHAGRAAELRKTFGRYLTQEVVYQLLDTPQGLKMGGERRTVTMLMADLRGFSSASEHQPPEQVVMFLNQYLEIMTDVINRYQGTIDEFLGDGILVLFGAPTARSDDADRAVACAIAMQQAMAQVNQYTHLIGVPTVEMGIGINTGEVVVGNIGSLKRAKYGIVGSHMNLTARIESYTVGEQILISDATYQAVRAPLETQGIIQIETKGFQQAITLHDLKGIRGSFDLSFPEQESALDPLLIPIPIQFAQIKGKFIQTDRFYALLRQVSSQGALLQSPIELAPLTNLKLNLHHPNRNADFYAKVQRPMKTPLPISPPIPSQNGMLDSNSPALNFTYQVRFTFIPPEIWEELQHPVLRPVTKFPTTQFPTLKKQP